MLSKIQICDATNPQGFVCQSKADVKCKQHLVLLNPIYSLPSFLLFALLPHQWQLTTLGCSQKRNVSVKSSKSILATLTTKTRVSFTTTLPSNALRMKDCTTLKYILSQIRPKAFALNDGLASGNQ